MSTSKIRQLLKLEPSPKDYHDFIKRNGNIKEINGITHVFVFSPFDGKEAILHKFAELDLTPPANDKDFDARILLKDIVQDCIGAGWYETVYD